MWTILHAILMALLWMLAGLAGLLTLILLLLCISVGIHASNRTETMSVWLKIGWLSIRLMPRKPLTEKQKAKKEAKKKRKAEKKALKKSKKQEQKARKAEKQAKQNKRNKKRKHPSNKPNKPPKTSDTYEIIRTILAALGDYDDEYLKLICIRRLELDVTVGGGNPYETGKRYEKAAELFGWCYPQAMRWLNIRRHRIYVRPDFVANRTSLSFDVTVTIRPICLLKSALVFWNAYRRNRRIYRKPKPDQVTVSREKYTESTKKSA